MNNLEIAHRRLRNQGLSKIIFKSANDIVTQLGAVQAQDYAGAKWALGQRLKDSSDAALDKAFADGSILRTHLLRPTWHFVSPTDIRWLLMLTGPRVQAGNAFMYRKMELDRATFKKSNAVLEKVLQGGAQLTRTEFASAFEQKGIFTKDGIRLGLLMMNAELDGVICSGARRGKQFTYALLEERVPLVKSISREEALAELSKRYFNTRGPATIQDFAWWSGLTMSDAKNGIEMNQSQFKSEAINDQTYWFNESKSSTKVKSLTAYLLPNYDEYFIGFKDRSAIGGRVSWSNLDESSSAFIAHILFIDGQIVGGWRREPKKDSVIVELNLITKLKKAEHEAIADASERYGKFLGLPVELA